MLEKFTLKKLQAACKAAGIKGYSSKNKADLIAWITSSDWSSVRNHLEAPKEVKTSGGEVELTFEYAGRAKPIPADDPWSDRTEEKAIALSETLFYSYCEKIGSYYRQLCHVFKAELEEWEKTRVLEEEEEDESWPWREEKPWFLDPEEDESEVTEDRAQLSEFCKKYRDGLPRIGGKSISFGWTSKELLAGLKSATRRTWKTSTAEYFRRKFEEGVRFFPARDKSHYAKNGKQIGWIELTSPPYQQWLSEMSRADLAAEGFPNLPIKYPLSKARKKFMEKFFDGKDQLVWVIEFKFHQKLPQSKGLRITPSDSFELKAG